jgi:hypothetical protein
VLGSQEAMRSIQTSLILPGKEKLNKALTEYLNKAPLDKQTDPDEEFVMINSVSLCAVSLSIFIRKKHVYYLSDIKNDAIATGIADMVANKGGVCISFKIGGKRMLFINCHQEAH